VAAIQGGAVTDIPETHLTHSADGTSLGYLVTGDGPLDVVMLGGTSSAFELMWDDPGFRRFAKRLGSFSRTLWPEPSVHGASERWVQGNVETSDADLDALLDAVGATDPLLP
jgi:hypothetical protein